MNFKIIWRFHGWVLLLEAVFLLPAIGISLLDGTQKVTISFLIALAAMLLSATVLLVLSRRAPKDFYAREGFFCVASSWILLSLFGCLPFCISGEIPNFIDALFEMVSGFTTTGASIVPDVEQLSRAILYWRSFSHWVGGMGVLVFLLAVAPAGGKGNGFTMHLFRAESPGPEVGKLVPKIRQTAALLYGTYVALTIINFLFLFLGGMPLFDSVCTAFGTAGTGGFGIKADSLAGYSTYIQVVCTVFMLLFSINFSCYYLILMKQIRSVLRDEELRLFGAIVVGSILLITWNIYDLYGSFWEALHHSSFQVASIISTSGFSSTDFDLWPSFSKAILLLLMTTGACAGSTCGGMKCARVLLLFKGVRRNVSQLLHPQRVQPVRVNGRAVDERTMANTNAYLSAYALILVASFLLVSLDGFTVITNFSAVMTCFNNVGPGFDLVGPMRNFALYSPLSKLVLIFDMLAGRLEIFPILVLFSGIVRRRTDTGGSI